MQISQKKSIQKENFQSNLCSKSYNLDDMVLVKCAYHSRDHAAMDDAVVAVKNVIVAGAVESAVIDAEALERFCGQHFADEHDVVVVAGLDFVTVVAELEFQYLQEEEKM